VSEGELRWLVIELPLPPDVLRPNRIGGANKYAVSRARREARAMACHLTCHAWHGQPARMLPGQRTVFWHPMPVWTHVRAVATFHGVSSQMDRPNAEGWLKATVDGIADALMGGGDHGWEWEDVRFERGPKGVTIEVWPISEGESA
jgi:hypothetical protein